MVGRFLVAFIIGVIVYFLFNSENRKEGDPAPFTIACVVFILVFLATFLSTNR